jgi:ferredoxin
MHHQSFNGNYGLFFTWWDVWMGTEFSNYKQKHQQVFTPQASLTPKTNNKINNVKGNVQLCLANGTYNFLGTINNTLLPAVIANNIPAKYACKKGQCGLCKLKCTVGTFTTAVSKAITQPEIDAGMVLLCCSTLTSPKAVLVSAN